MNQKPRDLLLARHAAAAPRLDAIRSTAVSESLPVPANRILAALYIPNRRLWAAIAAVWIVILALHSTQPQSPRPDPRAVEYAAKIHAASQTQLYALLSTLSSDR